MKPTPRRRPRLLTAGFALGIAVLLSRDAAAVKVGELVQSSPSKAVATGADGAVYWVYANHWHQQVANTGYNNTLAAASVLENLAVGIDALWITEPAANVIWQVPFVGAPVPHPLPTPNAGLSGICMGPDGNVWFTEMSANKVGVLRRDQSIDEWPLPFPGSAPYAIAAGRSGKLYFTEYVGNKIGVITTSSGFINEIPLATASAGPAGIMSVTDKIVFAESAKGKLGFVNANTDQLSGEWNLPDPSSTPWSVAVGPDFAYYVTERATNKICRVVNILTMQEFPVPSAGADPFMIATDRSGRLWFNEYASGHMGYLDLVVPGDVNGDGGVDAADVFTLINFLFAGGPNLK